MPEISLTRVEDIDYEATDDGRLRVSGSVPSDDGAKRLTTVEVRVSIDNERTTQSRELAVSAGGTADFEIELDIEYDALSDDGGLNVSLVWRGFLRHRRRVATHSSAVLTLTSS